MNHQKDVPVTAIFLDGLSQGSSVPIPQLTWSSGSLNCLPRIVPKYVTFSSTDRPTLSIVHFGSDVIWTQVIQTAFCELNLSPSF